MSAAARLALRGPVIGGPALRGLALRGLALLAAGLAAGALAAGTPAAAQLVAPEGRPSLRNGSTLPLEDEGRARETLGELQAAIDRGEVEEAAALLRVLEAGARPALVPFGPRTHMPAYALAARMVADTGSPALRARIEADLGAAVDEARRIRDLTALLDLATRAPALEGARAASLAAARLCFERGSWWEAEALAARAGDLPGAPALREAAARHLPGSGSDGSAGAAERAAAGPDAPSSWRMQGGYRFPFLRENDDGASLPGVADGLPGEIVLLRTRGVVAVERATGRPSFGPLSWIDDVLPETREGWMDPYPAEFRWARDGARLIVPLNLLARGRWREARTPVQAFLVALDLAQDGRPAWTARLERGSAASVALGPPAVAGSRVFAQVFRVGATTEVSLAAFDAGDGRLLFETPLVSAAQVRPFTSRLATTDPLDFDKRAKEGPVAVRDGLVYACTGHGVVAVVDGLTGGVRHTFRYDRRTAQDADRFDPAFLFDTGGWEDEPVRLHGERLVVAPGDSRFLYMLALEPGPRGQLILDDPIERLDRLHVAGLRDDPAGSASPAVLCTRRRGGRGGLVLLGPDGRTLESSPLLPAAEPILGRPLALAGRVLVPTGGGLLAFDAADLGRAPERLPGMAQAPTAVVAAHALRDGGLATLSQSVDPGYWFVLWREAAR